MTHGSLFSGIGGFDLAADWMGWENKFHCEWNNFGQTILKHYWPNAKSYTDITKSDFTVHRGQIDILTGGFPCQPYSLAGKRKGKEDERHLWPEMLRAIREVQPRWVVGENVFGLVNWSGGLVFHEVQADLEAAGYEVFPYVLPAAAVSAPHRRDRVWFVAYSRHHSKRQTGNSHANEGIKLASLHTQGQSGNRKTVFNSGLYDLSRINTNAHDKGLERGTQAGNAGESGAQRNEQPQRLFNRTDWSDFPTQSPVCHGNDGISSRLDGITFPKWRNESIKAGGNAIVPNVAHQIFKTIEEYEYLNSQKINE